MNRKFVILSAMLLIVAGFAGCVRDDGGSEAPPTTPRDSGDGGAGASEFDRYMEDPRVRQALSYAFPYLQVQENVYHGYMIPLAGPIPQGMPFHDTQTQVYEENLQKASEILDAAGYTAQGGERFNGEPLRIIYNEGNTQREQVSALFAQNLDLIGINAQVDSLPWPQFLDTFFGTNEWDIVFLGWAPDYNDPDNYWFPFAASKQIEGHPNLEGDALQSGYSNPALDRILLDAKFEADEERRAALYAEAFEMYIQEPSLIFVGQAKDVHTYRTWVQGFQPNPMIVEPGYFHDLWKDPNAQNPNRFVYGTLGDPARLDPHDAYDTASGLVIQNVYDTLVRYEGAETEEVVPRLATHWETNDDGDVWTFHLREDVKFSDGTPMTAEDVAYSFERILKLGSPETGVSWIVAQYLEEGGVKAVGDHTVEFHLTQPYGGFLPTLAYTLGGVISKDYCEAHGGLPTRNETGALVDSGCAEHLNENPMGTNAYVVKSWAYQDEIILEPNPHYWEGWTSNSLDTVIIRNIAEPSTRVSALIDGVVDFIAPDLDKLDELRGRPGVTVAESTSFSVNLGIMNTNSEWS